MTDLPLYKTYREALDSDPKVKDLVRIGGGYDEDIRTYVFVGDGFYAIYPEHGRKGLPSAQYFDEGYKVEGFNSTWIVRDGYWVELVDDELQYYKKPVDILEVLRALTREFKCPKSFKHYFSYDEDSDNLLLNLWVSDLCHTFYVTADELRDTDALITNLKVRLS